MNTSLTCPLKDAVNDILSSIPKRELPVNLSGSNAHTCCGDCNNPCCTMLLILYLSCFCEDSAKLIAKCRTLVKAFLDGADSNQ